MKNKFSFSSKIMIAALVLSGCGSNSFPDRSYAGTWDVRYNLVFDDCQLVTPGITGFVSEHQIDDQGDGSFILSSNDALMEEGQGTVREDGSFLATESFSGDLFEDGSFCTITTDISYAEATDKSTETLFSYEIECNDGFACASQAMGEATKRI